jgi:hypothetical protein
MQKDGHIHKTKTKKKARFKPFGSHRSKVQSVLGRWNLFFYFYLLGPVVVLLNMGD